MKCIFAVKIKEQEWVLDEDSGYQSRRVGTRVGGLMTKNLDFPVLPSHESWRL